MKKSVDSEQDFSHRNCLAIKPASFNHLWISTENFWIPEIWNNKLHFFQWVQEALINLQVFVKHVWNQVCMDITLWIPLLRFGTLFTIRAQKQTSLSFRIKDENVCLPKNIKGNAINSWGRNHSPYLIRVEFCFWFQERCIFLMELKHIKIIEKKPEK